MSAHVVGSLEPTETPAAHQSFVVFFLGRRKCALQSFFFFQKKKGKKQSIYRVIPEFASVVEGNRHFKTGKTWKILKRRKKTGNRFFPTVNLVFLPNGD